MQSLPSILCIAVAAVLIHICFLLSAYFSTNDNIILIEFSSVLKHSRMRISRTLCDLCDHGIASYGPQDACMYDNAY